MFDRGIQGAFIMSLTEDGKVSVELLRSLGHEGSRSSRTHRRIELNGRLTQLHNFFFFTALRALVEGRLFKHETRTTDVARLIEDHVDCLRTRNCRTPPVSH